MVEASSKGSKWTKLKRVLGGWEYWVGALGIALTVAIVIAAVFYWEDLRRLGHYGYLGAFLISVFGGASILAPIPMTPAVFALGTIMKPDFAPYLGPIFVGAAAGLGETIGSLAIYMTGYGGGSAFFIKRHGRLEKAYARIMSWMERRGSLILFLLSAVLNPFFYPAALTAGALKFGIRRFFLICWAGKTIKGISVAAAGYWGLAGLLKALGVPL